LAAHYYGSKRLRPYFERDLATTALNLAELAASLLRSGAIKAPEVDGMLQPLRPMVVEPGPRVVREAALFKVSMQATGLNCSPVDAWGYATARSLGVPFLTGDEAFRKVPHVEFVKE